MASRDLYNNIKAAKCLATTTVADNTPFVGAITDTAGFESVTYIITSGGLADADATFTLLIEDGTHADLTDHAAVDDAFLLGTEALASFTFAEDDTVKTIGVKSHNRYVRPTITPAANGGNATFTITAVLGHPSNAPTH